LHVASEDDEIDPEIVDHIAKLLFGDVTRVAGDRNVMKRDAVVGGHGGERVVIRHNRDDLEGQISVVDAIENVEEAVVVLGDHDHDAVRVSKITNSKIGAETFEISSERLVDVGEASIRFEVSSHRKETGHGIGELVVFEDVATEAHHGLRDGENNSRLVGALERRDEVSHGYVLTLGKVQCRARRCSRGGYERWAVDSLKQL
jgi:hypothetical protein